MAYHTSIYLFVFLPVVLLVYQLTPKKLRWMTLLLSGYVFFWTISGKLVLYLIGTTLFTHYIGVWMSWMKLQCETAVSGLTKEESSIVKKRYKQKEKWILIGGILGLLLALAYLKYYNFFAKNINAIIGAWGGSYALQTKELLLPIGISFYTLQAIGYMADVYWGKLKVEQHPGKLALFLGFFPLLCRICLFRFTRFRRLLFLFRDTPVRKLHNHVLDDFRHFPFLQFAVV